MSTAPTRRSRWRRTRADPATSSPSSTPTSAPACGICAGSCPSSTPFRRRETLITGIDMPQLPVNALRQQLEQALAQLAGRTRIVVFSCARGAQGSPLAGADTAVIELMCTGMLPPAFVEYALRGGADGVAGERLPRRRLRFPPRRSLDQRAPARRA
jgi:hypothetical protein